MIIKANKSKSSDLDEQSIADYLAKNPAYFVDRDALLLQMHLPHQKNGTISLLEKQVSLLRERNNEFRKKIGDFIATAKTNEFIFSRCQNLILSLIDATDEHNFFSILEHNFRHEFKCSAYSLIAFDQNARQINHFTSIVSEAAAREYVASLMKSRQPTLGILRSSEQDFLFRHQSNKVKSAAVISIKDGKQPIALLAIGSDDPHYFEAGMGTLFFNFVADALSRLLPNHLSLSPLD